jgi:hypothetical protein
MAGVKGRVVDVRSDHDRAVMDVISRSTPALPSRTRAPDRVCFVIAVERAAERLT